MITHIKPSVAIPELKATTTNSGRTYQIPSGEKYPSITTMLGHKEKPWLADWQNMLGANKAAVIGTNDLRPCPKEPFCRKHSITLARFEAEAGLSRTDLKNWRPLWRWLTSLGASPQL